MKRLTLFSLGLIALSGCGDTMTTDQTAANKEPDRYEVNKPVLEDKPALHETAPAPVPDSTLPETDSDLNGAAAPDSTAPNLNEAAAPSPQGPVDTDLTEEPVLSNDAPADDPAKADLVAGIRTQIDDADLSDAAEKIEVVSEDGKVTLSGKVANQAEKDRIEEIAIRLAGEDNVTNKLEIEE